MSAKSLKDFFGELDPPEVEARSAAHAHFGADYFIGFCEAHYHDKSKASSEPEPFRFAEFQKDQIRKLMVLDAECKLAGYTWLVSWPRRHLKTGLCGMYELARCLHYPNQLIVIQASSEEQAEDAALSRVVELIRFSPNFRVVSQRTRESFDAVFNPVEQYAKRFPGDKITLEVRDGNVRFSNGSRIVAVPSGVTSVYGQRISVYRATELHLAKKEDAFNAGSGSTGDSWCGLTIVDSTQGSPDQVVARITESGKLAEETEGRQGDATTIVSHVYYEDLRDAIERGPSWIPEGWLRSMAMRMLPSDFARNHLNRSVGAGCPVFSAALLRLAREKELSKAICSQMGNGFHASYTPKEAFRMLRRGFRGHGVELAYGLDRAMGMTRGDRTVLTVMAAGVDEGLGGVELPVYDDAGDEIDRRPIEPVIFFPLAVVCFPWSRSDEIKRAIAWLCRLYGEPVRMNFETYQAKDLADWAADAGYSVELVNMTDANKAMMVRQFNEALAEGRVVLPANKRGPAGLLNAELERYSEEASEGRFPKYGGKKSSVILDLDGSGPARTQIKDDSAESALWGMHGLRLEVAA